MTEDSGLVVRDVTVRAVVVPLRRPLATRVGDFPRWPLLLIDVTTEQGITGRGYLAPYLSRSGHREKSPTLVASGRRSGTTTARTTTSRTTSPAS